MEPTVSVVLPVYNCPQYVGEAIESILGQSFTDFELIVIDDGSTDETPGVLRGYSGPRIRQMSQSNRGLAETLNHGIELSRGRYIARQDQDDVSSPERLARQVAFMDAHPNCALVGTWAEIWRDHKRTNRAHMHPSEGARLKFELLLNNPFVHSSVMMRKSALDEVGAYCTDRDRQPPEDYELWSRIARSYDVANIPEILHAYREVESSMSRAGPSPFLNHLVTICAENIAIAAGESPDNPQVVNIAALTHAAAHRVNGEPNFDEMRRIFLTAARNVVPEVLRSKIEVEASGKIDALHYRLFEMRSDSRWRRFLTRVMRRARQMGYGN